MAQIRQRKRKEPNKACRILKGTWKEPEFLLKLKYMLIPKFRQCKLNDIKVKVIYKDDNSEEYNPPTGISFFTPFPDEDKFLLITPDLAYRIKMELKDFHTVDPEGIAMRLDIILKNEIILHIRKHEEFENLSNKSQERFNMDEPLYPIWISNSKEVDFIITTPNRKNRETSTNQEFWVALWNY